MTSGGARARAGNVETDGGRMTSAERRARERLDRERDAGRESRLTDEELIAIYGEQNAMAIIAMRERANQP